MAAMVQSGLDLSALITHRFHYTQFQEAFDVAGSGKAGKVILDWSEKA
jgi:threonine 3-dehydrogenase